MADKKDVADRLRELLGVDVSFEKLDEEELSKLHSVLTNMAQLAQVGLKGFRGKVQSQLLDRPLKQVLTDRTLFGEKGLLGFGLLGKGTQILGDNGPLGLGLLTGGKKKEEKSEEAPETGPQAPSGGESVVEKT